MRFIMLIAICIVVGVFIFGENPLREFQRKQKELMAKYGNDELTIKTNLYLEQRKSSGTGWLGGGVSAEPSSERDILNSIKSSASDNAANDNDAGSAVKVAEPNAELPEDNFVGVEVKSSASSGGASRGSGSAGGVSNYYPPIIGQVEGMPERKQVVFTGKEPRLRSGQVIAFDGASVYIVDQYGDKKPMPDGTYNLQDGSRIVVSNGKSMLR